MQSFTVTAARDGEQLTVVLTGELDMGAAADAAAVIDPLIEGQVPAVVVFDLGGLTFIDSSGLGPLVGYRNDGLAAGFSVTLRNAGQRTLRLLAITHLDGAFRTEGPGQTGSEG